MARRVDIEKKVLSTYRAARKDIVLILQDEVPSETKTEAGIIIPHQVAIDSIERIGTVVDAGKDISAVKQGDRVFMIKAYGINIPHPDSDVCRLVMVSLDQIEGILTGAARREDYDFYVDGLD